MAAGTSVFGRAREQAQKKAGNGRWIDDLKDDMIRDQLTFGIVDIAFDEKGSQFGERWIVSVEPWYKDQEDPSGDLSLKSTAYRDDFFQSLQAELDRLEASGEDVILGPCVLIKAKTANGKNRFYDIVEWDEDAQRAVLPEGVQVAGREPEPRQDTRRARPSRDGGRARPQPQEEPEETPPPRRGRPARAATSAGPSSSRAQAPASARARASEPEPDEESDQEQDQPAGEPRRGRRARSSRTASTEGH